MGLSISTGILVEMKQYDEEGLERYKSRIQELNEVLTENDLPAHEEPEEFPEGLKLFSDGYPYSFLHYLRRAYAKVEYEIELTPCPEGENPAGDEDVEDLSTMFDSHLLCHSDCEGYYVPQDFDEPIFDDRVPGTMLGSSQKLQSEILTTVKAIGLKLPKGKVSEELYREISREQGHPFERERLVAVSLLMACQQSIDYNTLIVFG